MLGFAAGPEVTVIDRFALGDALLARLPVEDPRRWRIGHFARALPEGYLHARETGDASRMQPELMRYFEALRLVVSGPLLDRDRLLAIARLNAGAYDGLLETSLQRKANPAHHDPRAAARAASARSARAAGRSSCGARPRRAEPMRQL
jgi:hypothetical protein